MTLQEFEDFGGCDGCYFYCEIEKDRKVCTFGFLMDSDEWEYARNCDGISEESGLYGM